MCKICDIVNATDINPFTNDETDVFVTDVFNGLNTVYTPNKLMYFKTADKLSQGMRLGLALADYEFSQKDVAVRLAEDLATNVYKFSAAKTYQQIKTLNALLIDSNGNARTYTQYQKIAKGYLNTTNTRHLAAEYQRAIAGSQTALQWQQIVASKDVAPNLQYQTVGDDRVRPTHVSLDNIIRPIDDAFWNSYYPPNGWNCRCTTLQITESDGEITNLDGFVKPNDVPDEFMINTGQQRLIYSDKHPYYTVEPRDANIAVSNYNLPKPSQPLIQKAITPTKADLKQAKQAEKSDVFVPAKTIDEVKQRIVATGVENVDLAGVNLEYSNAILQAIEDEAKYKKFNLKAITTHKKPKSRADAFYRPSTNEISFNISKLNRDLSVHRTYADDVVRLKEQIESDKAKYLNNVKYNQASVLNHIQRLQRLINDLERKIANNEVKKAWTVSETMKTKFERLRSIATHEIGHARHYVDLNVAKFTWFSKNSVTEYGMENMFEYFAEWFTQYRINGPDGVPDEMIQLFKKIGNANTTM